MVSALVLVAVVAASASAFAVVVAVAVALAVDGELDVGVLDGMENPVDQIVLFHVAAARLEAEERLGR